MPPGVVTETLPVEPEPTMAWITVSFTTTKDAAAVPPKLTAVVPTKLVPLIVMLAPEAPEVGVKEVIVGAGIVNVAALVAVPPGVVTASVPDVPLPILAIMVVALVTEKELAVVPPKVTAVAPVKLVPVIVTVAPTLPVVGVKEVIVGAAMLKPGRLAVPPGEITVTLPEVPLPTTAVIVVAFTTVNDEASVPPKLTAVVPTKLVPVIVTVAPTAAAEGEIDVMVGAA